jgi:hypothetical protein
MKMSNNNREIEELKKRIEELEKASLNATEEIEEEIPQEEVKKITEEGVDFDGEIRKVEPSEETPEEEPKKENLSIPIAIITIFAVTVFIVIFLAINGNNFSSGGSSSVISELDKKMANQGDDERGYVVFNEKRVWFDYDLYEKNQKDKNGCFWYQPQGDYAPEAVCPATNEDIEIAKQKGIYIDDPATVFIQNRVDAPSKDSEKNNTDTTLEKSDKQLFLNDDGTFTSYDTGSKVKLIDGWIVEKSKGNENEEIDSFTLDFYDTINGSVTPMKSKTGKAVVSFTGWGDRNISLFMRESDPSYVTLIRLIEDRVAHDVNNEKYTFTKIIIKGGKMWTNNAYSTGHGFFDRFSYGVFHYFKSEKPLKIIKDYEKCDEYDTCTKMYVLGY